MTGWRMISAQRLPHLVAGGAVTVLVALGVAVLSQWPSWRSLPQDAGLLRLSFTHSGARVCRDRTPQELAKLPPNMRAPQVCERRRAAVWVALEIDGAPVFSADLPPSGISGSGPSRAYKRFVLPAGAHRLVVKMRDDPTAEELTREDRFEIDLDPAESIAIDFDPTAGRFFLH
jgi:hypothetical protein